LAIRETEAVVAFTCAGTVYKVLAFADCPVITLSPVVVNACGTKKERFRSSEVSSIDGVI
jgi:hypothetical protein